MAGYKGIAAALKLAQRVGCDTGGHKPRVNAFDRSAPDSMVRWRDAFLESLAARNYSPKTVSARYAETNIFFTWAAERELTRASQITRPILESYQRWLWRCLKANGQRLSWSTQHSRLTGVKEFFRWLTRQNVIVHNPASELELPRMEKRLPHDVWLSATARGSSTARKSWCRRWRPRRAEP